MPGRRQALDGRDLEQVRGVGEFSLDSLRRIGEVEGQVEARIGHADRERLDAQGRVHRRSVAARSEDVLVDLDLEQRVVAQVALRRQGVHQLLEGQFLMGLRAGHHLLHLFQQLLQAVALVHLNPQDLGVDEETDQPLQLFAVTPGVRRTDTDIGLAAVARQHHGQGRQGQHEDGLAVLPGQALELRRQRRGQMGVDNGTSMTGRGRTLVVQGQLQHRLLLAQLLLPVGQLPLALPGFQPGTLPDRIVGILDRQGRRGCTGPGHLGEVEPDELPDQQFARPTVRHNVVHAQGQDVLGLTQAPEPDPQQGTFQQVERRRQFGPDQGLEPRLKGFGGLGRDVDPLQDDRRPWQDLLMELALHRDEARAQGLVALHQQAEGAAHCRLIQGTRQAHRHRHVIGAVVRVQLPEDQHLLLGIGQRDPCDIVAGHGNWQQLEALPALAHFLQDLAPLFQRQADEALGNPLCCSLVHLKPPPFRSSFFQCRTARHRSGTGRCLQRPGKIRSIGVSRK